MLGIVGYALAAVGLLCFVAWLWALVRVMRRRPDLEVRRGLLRVFDDVLALLEALAGAAELSEEARRKARNAYRYARWPIDLWPFGRSDDLVLALDAVRAAVEDGGPELVERLWSGDEVGLNAVRVGLGEAPRWEA